MDCTCPLRDFHNWLIEAHQVDAQSRRNARCATPPAIANAALGDLPDILCTLDRSDRSNADNGTGSLQLQGLPDKRVLALVSSQLSGKNGSQVLSLTWDFQAKTLAFTCTRLQMFCEALKADKVRQSFEQEVYSGPADCSSLEAEGRISVSIDTSDMGPCQGGQRSGSPYLVCIFLQDGARELEFPECDRVFLGPRQLPGNLRATLTRQLDGTLVVAVTFDPEPEGEQVCKVHIQVVDSDIPDHGDGEAVVAAASVPCQRASFNFTDLAATPDYLMVCSWVEAGSTGSSASHNCVKVIGLKEDQPDTSDRKGTTGQQTPFWLPLLLGLLVLVLGILTTVYCVAKRRQQVSEMAANGRPMFIGRGPGIMRPLMSLSHHGLKSWTRKPKYSRRHLNGNDDEFWSMTDDDLNCTEMSTVRS